MGKIIDPFPADDRDGDLASSSRTELEGTHGQRGRGSYCPNQLICVFSDLPTGLTYFNKDVVFFFFFSKLQFYHFGSSAMYITLYFIVGNLHVGV